MKILEHPASTMLTIWLVPVAAIVTARLHAEHGKVLQVGITTFLSWWLLERYFFGISIDPPFPVVVAAFYAITRLLLAAVFVRLSREMHLAWNRMRIARLSGVGNDKQ